MKFMFWFFAISACVGCVLVAWSMTEQNWPRAVVELVCLSFNVTGAAMCEEVKQ